MLILGIETSCDETSAGVLERDKKSQRIKLLSNVVASSISFHRKTGGIIPEKAAREQIKFILPVISEAFSKAKLSLSNPPIDAIAVTVGPGLIGSLLIGVETAKTLSLIWNKPIIPVNHLIGHIYANFVSVRQKSKGKSQNLPKFPAIGLVVSGGHTDLVLIKNHGNIRWIGGTRDDAAGEALDKIGRLLGLPYPGGPIIEERSKEGRKGRFHFPRPLLHDQTFDFSFSGLKTAVLREVQNKKLNEQKVSDICLDVQSAIIEVLVDKTLRAAQRFSAKSILLGGGVTANLSLRERFKFEIRNSKFEIPLFVPEKRLCTDNAAMIAAAAFYQGKIIPWQKIEANPSLHF